MIDLLRENDTYVCQLREAIGEGSAGLSGVPMLVKRIINEDRWRKRRIKTNDEPEFKHFEEFVRTPPLEGLGATLDLLIRLCKDDKDAFDSIDMVIRRKGGRPETLNNVQGLGSAPVGNSEQAAIRRLRKDRPDLLDKVKAGDLSAHAAMIEAGFRTKSITVPADPVAAARRLLKHFQGDSLATLISELSQGGGHG